MSFKIIYQSINILIKKNIFRHKLKNFSLIPFLMIIYSASYIFEKPLMKFQENKLGIESLENNVPRDLEEIDDYDSYFILYFNQDCTYKNGFKNDFRNNISFIINREKNTNLTSEETLVIH